MDRRDALLIGATAAVGGWIAQKELLVGSDGSDGESGGESDSSPEPTESSDDSTPTDDSSSSSTPEIGQPFELSNVEYLVKTVRTAERLGSEMNPLEPEGVFVLTAVSVTNNRSEVIEFPGTNYRIRSRDTWSYQDEQATQEAPNDERIELESWIRRSVTPDGTKVGLSVFDVDPETAFELWFLSVTDGEDSSVSIPIGEPQDLDRLQGVLTG